MLILMTSFNLQHLKYFYDSVRLNSVSKAAKENYVTQSAVSQGISKLERDLKHTLLEHHRNRIRLTDVGRSLFERAGSALSVMKELEDSLGRKEQEYVGHLTVGCTQSMATGLLQKAICLFMKKAPRVSLKIVFGHAALLKQWALCGSIDIGFALDNEDLSGLEVHHFYEGKFRFFSSSYSRKSFNHQCVFTEPRRETNLIKKAYKKRYGVPLDTLFEMGSWGAIADYICESKAVGYIPDYLAKGYKLKEIDLDLSLSSYQLYIVHHPNIQLSRNAHLFVEFAQKSII